MKTLFIALFCPLLLFGEYLFEYEEIFDRGQKTKTIPMLVVGATTCSWTDKLKEKTLTDSGVMAFIEKHFALQVVDQDFDDVAIALHAEFTPTTHFLDYKGEVFWQAIGYKEPKAYLEELKNVVLMWRENRNNP